MAAVTVDQDAAQTHLAHLAGGDLERSAVGVGRCLASDRARHPVNDDAERGESDFQSLVWRNAAATQRVVDVDKATRNRYSDIPNSACSVEQSSGLWCAPE